MKYHHSPMKKICTFLLFCIMLFNITACVEPDSPSDPNLYKHVIIIGIDGAGAFFQNADTPHIDAIFAEGATTYKMLTENPSISAQCWGSLLHGVTSKQHGLTNSVVEGSSFPSDSLYPSIFRVVRENAPNAKLASFCNWGSINTGIIENDINVHKVSDLSDAAITNAVCEYVAKNAPNLVFVQFDEADAVGHTSGYESEAQLNKINELDGYIGQIYQTYKDKGILDDTLFIVTSDHGGTGLTHGGYNDREKYVLFAATGKTVEKGTIGEMEIRDTAAIVLHAFGYQQPDTWTARVPSGLFNGIIAGDRPVYADKNSDRYHENTPTPVKGSDAYITNFITDVSLKYYLTFDDTIADLCGNETSGLGKLYYVEGYYGKGVSLDDGGISIKDFSAGTNSFSISMWVNTGGTSLDPVLCSNKNWSRGMNPGFAWALNDKHQLIFNFSDGSSRMDESILLPDDYTTGWMYVLLVVDRDANTVNISIDFNDFITFQIPNSLTNSTIDSYDVLNIGRDAVAGDYRPLAATIDEFMYFDGALDATDVAQLREYFGK